MRDEVVSDLLDILSSHTSPPGAHVNRMFISVALVVSGLTGSTGWLLTIFTARIQSEVFERLLDLATTACFHDEILT